ncbi:HAD family hydrolase [Actinomadura parmotrematis]|uniref:HAD hydrolase-like protein n=1 Tax=Actinomadura parmotrematis TaxID=2864039 RepID=A0ABS7FND3_9ACTN|nr:HAD family hydrolase [Actinomadura parmotrematis]MBW8481826.1 HAD hydrolase-like protein [Actinomadura parmotrematis]
MTGAAPITIACLDLAGTTVADGGALRAAHTEALAALGLAPGTSAHAAALARADAAPAAEALDLYRAVFADEARAQAAHLAFESSYERIVGRHGLAPVPGAEQALDELAKAGVRICLVSSLGRRTLGRVLEALGWWDRADFAVCPDGAGRGQPWPDLILSAALRAGTDDVRHIAVCGGTAEAMLAGRRAGASIVAGVRTGPHDAPTLRASGATHILPSVADLPPLLLEAREPADPG